MFKIEIGWDYYSDIINILDENDELIDTTFPLVEKDKNISKISAEINKFYWNYIEFNSHGEQVWWNEEGMRKNKQKMLALLKKLNDRLNEINDGSFIVEDLLTPYWEKL